MHKYTEYKKKTHTYVNNVTKNFSTLAHKIKRDQIENVIF